MTHTANQNSPFGGSLFQVLDEKGSFIPPRVLSWDLSHGVEGDARTSGYIETSGASGEERGGSGCSCPP